MSRVSNRDMGHHPIEDCGALQCTVTPKWRQPCSTASHITATSSRPATTPGASKAAMMIKQPALAPSPQPRPAPTVRALPAELAAQRGPFWMPIRGPNPTPI